MNHIHGNPYPLFDDSLYDEDEAEYVKGRICACGSRLIRTVIPGYEIISCSSRTCHYAVANRAEGGVE